MKNFESYVAAGVTPYHVVEETKSCLLEQGFQELSMAESWELKPGAYFTVPADSMLYAFVIGEQYQAGDACRLAVAHTDYPCLHIKPAGEVSGAYELLDVEVYGGPILNTWLDRPLGIAGRIYVNENGKCVKKLVDSKGPVAVIPNLPIHFNREVNKGVELKRQVDLRPIMGMTEEKGWFAAYLAELSGVGKEQILEADLYVYLAAEPVYVGKKKDILLSPRLDNQTSCYALLKGITEAKEQAALSVIALYDNEEVGSFTRQGADSAMFAMLLEKLYAGLHYSTLQLKEAIVRSRMASMDVAHALHPNHPERYDAQNTARMGDGVVLKLSSSQRYAYDPQMVAEMMLLLEKEHIPYCKHVNHSDQPGGSTMGPMVSSWLPMPTLDCGVPILAMHSACEQMAVSDQMALEKFAAAFLQGK